MRLLKLLWCLVLCLAGVGTAIAQDGQDIAHTIQSEAFGKERSIRVYLPDRYLGDSSQTYAVAYFLDAQSSSFWNMVKGNLGYLVDNGDIFPMIAVGIQSDDRGTEFSPPSIPLTNHLREEVLPLIEENYRVKPFRAIIGHSYGGLFVANTLFSENADLFDGYIGISPSMGFENGQVLKRADSMLKAKPVFKKFFYCSSGDVGSREAEFGGQVAHLDSLMQRYPNKSLAWKMNKFEGKGHWTCVIPSVNDGLVEMSRNYWVDLKVMEEFAANPKVDLGKAVGKYLAAQEKTFGYSVPLTAGYIRFCAQDFAERKDHERAFQLYSWALELDPSELRSQMGIANLHNELGNKAEAWEAFKKALELLEAHKDQHPEDFYNPVKEWLEGEIERLKP